jgi:hypothetical protein
VLALLGAVWLLGALVLQKLMLEKLVSEKLMVAKGALVVVSRPLCE